MFRPLALVAMLAVTGITMLAPVGATAQTTTAEPGDEVYKPSMGQAGKDVIWIPTPDALVTAMLTAAKVTKDDIVYDLGAGAGRIPIAAAQQCGARSSGIGMTATRRTTFCAPSTRPSPPLNPTRRMPNWLACPTPGPAAPSCCLVG